MTILLHLHGYVKRCGQIVKISYGVISYFTSKCIILKQIHFGLVPRIFESIEKLLKCRYRNERLLMCRYRNNECTNKRTNYVQKGTFKTSFEALETSHKINFKRQKTLIYFRDQFTEPTIYLSTYPVKSNSNQTCRVINSSSRRYENIIYWLFNLKYTGHCCKWNTRSWFVD